MSGSLLIVTAPSGAGKTTLVAALLRRVPELRLSVSYTTRSPRAGEQDGCAYHFIDRTQFMAMRQRDEFLECAEVHGNLYGTSRIWLEQETAAGRDVLLEIDWQGAAQVRRAFPRAISVFILPPSFEELEKRLRGRGKDSDDVIARRLAGARAEIAHLEEFDYIIINSELQDAIDDLIALVRSARLRTAIQVQRHRNHFAFQQD